jgi:hypothetical protein
MNGDALAEWAIRGAAGAALGKDISHPQFAAYRKRGLLGEPDADGHWPRTVVDRLVRIHGLAVTVRSLDRRTILLKQESVIFPDGEENSPLVQDVPPAALREAMIGVATSIRRPVRKMKLINSACEIYGRFLAAPASVVWNSLQAEPNPKGWRPPEPHRWQALLRLGSLAFFAQRSGFKFFMDDVIRRVASESDPQLAHQLEEGVPLEERATLLTIHEIALWRAKGFHIPEEEAADSRGDEGGSPFLTPA